MQFGRETQAVIDALPAHLSLIDVSGRIIAVNTAWRQFLADSARRDSQRMVGDSYLDGLTPVLPTAPDTGIDIAAEIRAVLQGSSPEFECEYLCPNAPDKQWFRMHVTPILHNKAIAGALISHSDVTSAHLAGEQAALAAIALENTVDAVAVLDVTRRVLSVNPAYEQISGRSREDVCGELFPDPAEASPTDQEAWEDAWCHLAIDGRWQGELPFQRGDGSRYFALLNIGAVTAGLGHDAHYVAVFNDVSRYRDYEEQLNFLAFHDPLTQLPNRLRFSEAMREALYHAQRAGNHLAVLMLDLDNFKDVNDSLGHAAGDELLREVSQRLRDSVRAGDMVARLGGDEFSLLLTGLRETGDAGRIADQIMLALSEPILVQHSKLFVTGSIGIACYPRDAVSGSELLRCADAAMYWAKARGRNMYEFFSPELNTQAHNALSMVSALHQALHQDEFLLSYQPIVDLNTGAITAVEALIRWRHPELGMVAPAQFIPLAEETGIVNELGIWVLDTACRQMRAWDDMGMQPVRLSVNVSARQFQRHDFVQRVADVLRDSGLPASRLELEITETTMMTDPARTADLLSQLGATGVSFAVDDFGTGYSSLGYLRQLPIHRVKVDRSFVSRLPDDADDTAIVQAIMAMTQSLRLTVVAEGVENRSQWEHLLSLGCQEGQGYLFSMPLSAEDLTWLRSNHSALPAAGTGAGTTGV